MGKSSKKIIREEWNRLRKAIEHLIKPGNRQPQWVLQPVRTKNNRNYK
ncbi:MAG: hypothetical protein IPP99_15875 [Chitinophagaceae bacterium]|nr:hypothetical protein [Chitinophagaceae bacterium]MBL0270093.1 hypothetical protein [Chitinophagaceae bacterium]